MCVVVELRDYEHYMLSILEKLGGRARLEELIGEGISDAAIMRAALTWKKEKLVAIHEKKQVIVKLNEEGKIHAKKGLPERRLLDALIKLNGKASLAKIVNILNLEKDFIHIALSWIQRKNWATYNSKTNQLQVLGKVEEGCDEKLLKYLHEKKQVTGKELCKFRDAIITLKKRKLLKIIHKTIRIFEITNLGKATVKKKKVIDKVTQLTPELIITGKWRKVKLQKYNIKASVAKSWPGKKHPYLQFLEEVKERLVTLGFKEMIGSSVETSFFNFDALYTPQDHPARESFGIYLVKDPIYGNLDAYKNALLNVKKTHENGWKTGSTGWKYKYTVQEARRLVLRGHGTCLSARTMLNKRLEIPGRYFSIARCYRPEVVDKTHLQEFNQVEGIVVEENLSLRDLLGVLKKFAIEIAEADEVRFKPDYFPFTEPSVELSAFKKDYGWIEFGGSGIFRPEVTMPLGINVPVIAWGLGIDRLFMMKAGIDDIRNIFTQNLEWIRKKKVV